MKTERKGKRLLGMLLALLLVFNGVLQGSLSVFAAEPKAVAIDITKFEIQNKDKTTANEVWITDTFLLMLQWDATKNGKDIHQGDFFDVKLPSNMWFPAESTARDFDLVDEKGVVLAKAHVNPGANDIGGTVHVTFSDKVENKYNIKGTMYLAAKFDKKQVKTEQENTFTITVNSDVVGMTQSGTDGVIIQGFKPINDEYINKWGGKVEGEPNRACWHVRINHRKGTLTNVVIEDSLQLPDEAFIPESFKLFKVKFNQYGDISSSDMPVDISSMLKFGAENKSFTLNLGDASNQQYYLEYMTTYTPSTKLKNLLKLTSTQKSAQVAALHQSAESGGTAGGDLASKIKLIKVDAEDNKITLADAVFTVTKPDNTTFELKTGPDGTVVSEILEQGAYKVVETKEPYGYLKSDEEFTLNVSPAGGAIQTITNKPVKINICGTKTWDDANNQDGKRPESIIVNLLADGVRVQEQEVKPDAAGNWKYIFKDLRKVKNGKDIKYTVTENPVTGYEPTVNEHNIVNKHVPEVIDIAGTKTWDDANNQDGKRPEKIIVNLFAGDEHIKTAEVKADPTGNWKYSFTGLPKYKDGKEIKYSVNEDVVQGYDVDIDGYNMTNKHVPEVIDIAGTKTWDDANNQDGKRPEKITVNLLADDVQEKSVEVTPDGAGNWKYSFTGLPKYKAGKEIKYTITETPVNGYTPTITGFDISNKYTPEIVNIAGTKTWEDANNQDGKRPEKITVNLLANDEQLKSVEVTPDADGNWKYSFTDLPKYKDGKEIKYTVTENAVAGYTTEIKDYDITNKHVPEMVEVTGTKTWDDANNQDGKRPEKITVNLLADGTQVKSVEVKADSEGNWKYSFTGLAKYKDGKEIKYTVTEEAVAGYTTEIKGFDITNKYTPEMIDIAGTKTWEDADNQDGKRPEMITVNLLADGTQVKSVEVKADSEGNWKYSFTGLAKYKDGKEIKYTVTEEKVAGYTTEIKGFDITNKYMPEMIEIAGTKTWDDADNQDGKRPEMITVNLLADGTQVKSVEVKADADGNWKYSFTGLAKYKDGKEIKYTVTENAVADYTTEINGFDIKNSYKPGMTSVTVTKRWDDADNKDKLRPTSIRVQLYADGEKVGEEVVLKTSDNWTYTWKDLPAMKNGKVIKYTVKEVGKVAGYTASVNDKDHGNIIITNSHKPKRPPVPKTGDGTDLTVVMAGLGVALVAICGAIVARKKFGAK